MCFNGDGSHYDDDGWRTMSGALNAREELLKLYTKTYEAERINSMTGGGNVTDLEKRLKRCNAFQ